MKMARMLFCIFLLSYTSQAQALPVASLNLVHQWTLDAIKSMPVFGGYELTKIPATRLRDAFVWLPGSNNEILKVKTSTAIPSYCTTATYVVFYKVLEKYWDYYQESPSKELLEVLKPAIEADGKRIWGRWNSNGPGTAKLVNDAKIGVNTDDWAKATPGDFMKIFWTSDVGKLEKGHSVIYLGSFLDNGVPMVKFWSSNQTTQGYSERVVKRSEIARAIFTKLTNLENIENVGNLPETDKFLQDMLTRVSTWSEVKKVSGIGP